MSHFSAARVIKIFIFVTVVLSFYAFLHATLALYLKAYLPVHPGWFFWFMGVFSVLTFIIAHGRHTKLSRALYLAGMLWMGLVFIANIVLVPVSIWSYFGPDVPLWAFLGTTALLAIGGFVAATMPRVKTVTIPIAGLRAPVTLVQISDVHLGEIYTPKYLARLVALSNKKHPDVVVLTGDLFDGAGVLYDGMIAPLRDLNAPALFITGNHEVYEGVYKTTELVKAHGVTVLDDQIKTVAGIQFVGVSYPLDFGDDKHRTILRLAKKVDRDKPIILLRHEPRRLDDGAFLGADLVLCGHTHNGQIWPLNYLIYFFYDYAVGLHKRDDTWIYISCGAGTWGPPYRIGSTAEIVEFRLVPKRRK
jgi:predicted MPP superfamily phosphohydrolase